MPPFAGYPMTREASGPPPRRPHPRGRLRARGLLIACGPLLACAVASLAFAAVLDSSAEMREAVFDNPGRCAFTHHSITARVDPQAMRIEATDEVLLRHPAGISVSRPASFLLHRSLAIESIQIARTGTGAETPVMGTGAAPLSWTESALWNPRAFWERPQYDDLSDIAPGRQIDLRLGDALSSAAWPESLTIAIRYAGVLYDSLRTPEENYQRGFETTTGLIDLRGVYLCGASLWYPRRFDEPCAFDLETILPQGWESVSQGRRMVKPAAPAGAALPAAPATPAAPVSPVWGNPIVWSSSEPMDEIYLIAGPYEVRERSHGNVAVQTFTYRQTDEGLCERYLQAAADYLDLYSSLIGPYPFPKFALVENFWQTGFGMPGFTLLGDRVIRLPFIIGTSYGHEILHNWWGNGVFVDGETGNWCEGLTVFGADYLYKKRESADAAKEYRRAQLMEYRNYARAGRDFSLAEFRERHDASSAAVGYGKSMMLYHMLERKLGEGAFAEGLRRFYARHLFRRASWSDLLASFQAAPAPGAPAMNTETFDAQAFARQWIERAGAPELRLASTDLLPASEGFDLTYTLEQTVPAYDLEVPMRATFSDREAVAWTVRLGAPSVCETRRLPAMPRTLEVDPDFDLFRTLHHAEVPAVLSRVLGADSLTFVIGGDLATRDRLRALAAESRSREQPARIVEADSLSLAELDRGGAWVLGAVPGMQNLQALWPDSLVIEATRFRLKGADYSLADHTLVLALPNPRQPEEAIGFVTGGAPEDFAAVWRKLPHYGKYSYLVFSGTQIQERGFWGTGRSPLKMVWNQRGAP